MKKDQCPNENKLNEWERWVYFTKIWNFFAKCANFIESFSCNPHGYQNKALKSIISAQWLYSTVTATTMSWSISNAKSNKEGNKQRLERKTACREVVP